MTDLTHIRVDQWSIATLNAHILASSSPFVLLQDKQADISDDAIQELLSFLKRNESIALVQPKITIVDTNLIHPFGGLGGFTDRLGVGYTRGASFGESEPDSGQYDMLNDTPDWIFAPVMIVRREAFERACGLDDSMDDFTSWMDLGARLRRMGYNLECYSSVVVSLPSISKSIESPTHPTLFPTIKFVIRHNDGPWVLVTLMWFLLELMYIPGNLLQFRFGIAVARLKSVLKSTKAMPEMIRDRYIINEGIEKARISDKFVGKPAVFSIFWRHFARLGKTASNLLTVFLVIASVFSLTMRDRR